MKKLAIAGAIIAGVVALVTVMAPLLVSSETVRMRLMERAREITGREMQYSGKPRVLYSPFLGIELDNVSFQDELAGDNSKPIVSMPVLKGKLSLADALRGKVTFSEFQFVRPHFNLTTYTTGQSSWSFPEGKVWSVLNEAKRLREEGGTETPPDLSRLTDISLGEFTVEDGVIEYEDRISGFKETLTNFNGTLVWPSVRAPWRFFGNYIWRGNAFRIATNAKTPVLLLAGGASPVSAQVESDPFNLTIEGEANRFSDLFFNGKFSVETPSLRRMLNLFGAELPPGSSLAAFSAIGDFSGTLTQAQIENGTFILDGNRSTGSLRAGLGETQQPRLSGTLAYETLDVSRYWLAESGNGESGNASILQMLLNPDLLETDLRLSAKSVITPAGNITNMAGGLISRGGKLLIDLGNAEIAGGLLVGMLELGAAEDKAAGSTGNGATGNASTGSILNKDFELTTSFTLGNFNPANAGFAGNVSAITADGPARIKAKLSTRGNSVRTLTRNLRGTASIAMKGGQLRGIDYSRIMDSLKSGDEEKSNIPLGRDGGASPVTSLEINANINRGVAWIRNSSITLAKADTRVTGKIDLLLGSMALWNFIPYGEAKSSGEGLPQSANRRFFIGGTIGQPLYLPEIIAPGASIEPGKASDTAAEQVPPETSNPDKALNN